MAYYVGHEQHWRMEALRVMAALPQGSRVDIDHLNDGYRVTLPGGANLFFSRKVMDERIANQKSGLATMMWNEFMERVKDLPPGAPINLDWLNEWFDQEKEEWKSISGEKDMVDTLLERD